MLETELKCIIDKNTFDKIANSYKWDKTITQTNHYYHSENNALKKHGITMRIREIDSVYKLQIKAHKNPGSPLQICDETEFDTDGVIPFFTAEETKKYTGVESDTRLIGSATTKRHSLMWNEHTEICLDHTTYLGTEDYEIEVEFTGECPQILLDELKELGVEFIEKSVGKYSRFIKKLKELSKN